VDIRFEIGRSPRFHGRNGILCSAATDTKNKISETGYGYPGMGILPVHPEHRDCDRAILPKEKLTNSLVHHLNYRFLPSIRLVEMVQHEIRKYHYDLSVVINSAHNAKFAFPFRR
jgi:hypothetical protein